MPELPEAEVTRRRIESWGAGRRITAVRPRRDPIVFEGVAAPTFRRALRGARIESVGRRGKQIFLALDRRPWMLLHLGMSGEVLLGGPGDEPTPALRLRRPSRLSQKSLRLELEVEDGGRFLFADPRRFGRVGLREDPLAEQPLAALGPDALDDLPPTKDLVELFRGRRATLKGVLLDQHLLAGIGNWIADELLYQARLDPRIPAGELDGEAVALLRRTLLRILRRAVDCDADAERFPKAWLFHHRWGRVEGVKDAEGEAIEFLTVAGRTTAWVPTRQAQRR